MKAKSITLLFAGCLIFMACKSNKTDSVETTIGQHMDEIKASTSTKGQEGKGKITLLCNGKAYAIHGVCGAVTSMGSLTIVVPDDSIPAKAFTISFTVENLPDASSTYTIVESILDDKDATHVSISYADMRMEQPMTWGSDGKTGKLDFAVNGNEIKCSFSNLALQPNNFFNKGELNNPATVSGELTLYKN